MRGGFITIGISVLTFSLAAGTVANASGVESAQSKSCWAKADQQSLTGQARLDFHVNCMKGAAVPPGPTVKSRSGTAWSKAVTAPSGADRSVRSRQCSTEADRRALVGGKRESFRLACLATAGPVRGVGSNTQPPAPSPQKTQIDKVPGAPPT